MKRAHGPPKARRAAATARSMSALSPSASVAMTAPVEGLTEGKVLPLAAGTQRPSINRLLGRSSRNSGMGTAVVVVAMMVPFALDRFSGPSCVLCR